MNPSGTVPPLDEVASRLARQNAALLEVHLEKVRLVYGSWTDGKVSLDALCATAGDEFDEYAVAAFEALLTGPGPADTADAAKWMREHYRRRIVGAAQAIRDVFTESSARHAAAQILQTRMLRAEARFRHLIDEPH